MACQDNRVAIVKRLLMEESLDVNLPRNNGLSPLLSAISDNFIEIVDLLLRHKSINMDSAQSSQTLQQQQEEQLTANDESLAQLYRADKNKALENGYTKSDYDVFFRKARTSKRHNPLLVAVGMNSQIIVKLLIDAKCDVNYVLRGFTPLKTAIGKEKKNHAIIAMLESAGAIAKYYSIDELAYNAKKYSKCAKFDLSHETLRDMVTAADMFDCDGYISYNYKQYTTLMEQIKTKNTTQGTSKTSKHDGSRN